MNSLKHEEEIREAIEGSVDLIGVLISRVINDSVGANAARKQSIFNACMITLNEVLEESLLDQPRNKSKRIN